MRHFLTTWPFLLQRQWLLLFLLLLLPLSSSVPAKGKNLLTEEQTAQVLQQATVDFESEAWEKGIARLQEALPAAPNPVPLLQLLGEGYLELGEPAEAAAALREALGLDPACLKCATKLAYVLVGLDEREQAREVLLAAQKRHPGNTVIEQHLALAGGGETVKLKTRLTPETQERVRLAQQDLEEQLRQFSVTEKSGESFLVEKDFSTAVRVLKKELIQHPDDPERWTNLGVAQDSLGAYEDAVRAHEKALAISPGMAVALNNRGHAMEMLERFDDAAKDYEKALSLSPSYGLALQNLANTLLKQEKVEEAIGANLRAQALDPKDPAPHNNMAFAWFKLGYCQRALSELEQARMLDTSQPTVKENIAFIEDAMAQKEGLCTKEDPARIAAIEKKNKPATAPTGAATPPSKTPPAVAKTGPPPALARGGAPPPLPGLGDQTWPLGGSVSGRLLISTAAGEVFSLKGAGVLRFEGEGLFSTSRAGVRAWMKREGPTYMVWVQRQGKPARVLLKDTAFKKHLSLSPDGMKLAMSTFSQPGWSPQTVVVDVAMGGALLKLPGKALALSWENATTLLMLGRDCGGQEEPCLKRQPLKGPGQWVNFGPTAKYLFYAEGAALSPVVKGVLYAPSPVLTDTLVRLDLNAGEVRLIQPPPLAKNLSTVKAVALREGLAAMALGVGQEVWIVTEKDAQPARFSVPGRVLTLDWMPY